MTIKAQTGVTLSPLTSLQIQLSREEARARRQRRTTLANTLRRANSKIAQEQAVLTTIYRRASILGFSNIAKLVEPTLVDTPTLHEKPTITLTEFAAAIDSAATWECEANEWKEKYKRLLTDGGAQA